MRTPWTHAELQAMFARNEHAIAMDEAAFPDVRPVPPLYASEALALLVDILAQALERPLTQTEGFLAGQLINTYGMAVTAERLGSSERCYVITDADIERSLESGR